MSRAADHESGWPGRIDAHVRRDVALVCLSGAAIGASYWAAAASPLLQLATAIAVCSATTMYARLAMGGVSSTIQLIVSAAVLYALGAAPRVVITAVSAGIAGAEYAVRSAGRSTVLGASPGLAIVAGGVMAVANALTAAGSYRESLAAMLGGFLGVPLLLAVGPFAEWLLGQTTRLTLTEWLSYEHPLLRELASAAPGTFQHSINVGVLADAAARAMDGDALVARLGGLYHDVGKVRAPEYFVENQHEINPHDDLPPDESARIVRAHVADGVDLIAAHRMEDRLARFVQEHHGTACMRLFRDKAAALGTLADGEDAAYCYPGPRPRSPETAIVMIADQLEATARSEPPADERACDDLVARTIARLQDEHQLDDAGLTPSDLQAISAAFSGALMAMHHRRMTYPPARPAPGRRRRIRLVPRVIGRTRG
jgi:putative nucleotidyltransferase with HDIG domain